MKRDLSDQKGYRFATFSKSYTRTFLFILSTVTVNWFRIQFCNPFEHFSRPVVSRETLKVYRKILVFVPEKKETPIIILRISPYPFLP